MPFELKAEAFEKVIDGKPVGLYTIRNNNGMVARITNFGAKIQQIIVPDRDGKPGDVVLGYESIDRVLTGQASMGAFLGRFASRLGKGILKLEGKDYQLAINDNGGKPNTLHGGKRGSRVRPFDARQIAENEVEMTILFTDGEEGFPGDLPVRVRYRLTDDNELIMAYDAASATRTTVANFSGHAFFNLSGDLGSSIEDHIITLNGSKVLEIGPELTPNGVVRDISGTAMDFSSPKALGKDINSGYDLIEAGNGYDHFYVIDQQEEGELTLHARVEDPKSGRVLEVWSTEPGVQFYSGNFLEGVSPRDVGKGAVFGFRSGLCLEPSHFPDGPNHDGFPTIVLKPGQWYSGQIVYRFFAGK